MCFDEDAIPPVPQIPDAAVESRYLELTAADGNTFAAFTAAPAGGTRTAIVILPDVRGLYGFYTELAKRFAENGVRALVIDYYGRTAGAARRESDFPYTEHMAGLTPRQLYADLSAGIAHLRSEEGGAASAVLTVGFCIGGRLAVMAAAGRSDLAGVIGFYCWPADGPDGSPGPTSRAADLKAPVLALMAGEDPGIPPAHVKAFDEALAEAGVDHEVVTYPGTPHSFFDAKRDAYADASADAWDRVLRFVDRVGAG
ncbi:MULTISPECIES: dienelactone hydrolase family protein [unclassified Streptomyces]|jgi:carboxymethylenebutenolidase|uniref:dienelactone hydrolase family protein n=1 Tax=unclassified Streptomyces TaxID=2593676 RepID=UPI00109EB341|nr:dienelactone hydrolase family protein [Streptomyces sp. XHT-2]THC59462.1 dienelactone hydrolase family protein [Streptomyces sp. Akac8]WTB85188.1 dienelactone hydrolase family protein [Streptomyces cellulosae]WTB92052.1 dienelactone hydrolase family protein [Streptomyces cellulosae]